MKYIDSIKLYNSYLTVKFLKLLDTSKSSLGSQKKFKNTEWEPIYTIYNPYIYIYIYLIILFMYY